MRARFVSWAAVEAQLTALAPAVGEVVLEKRTGAADDDGQPTEEQTANELLPIQRVSHTALHRTASPARELSALTAAVCVCAQWAALHPEVRITWASPSGGAELVALLSSRGLYASIDVSALSMAGRAPSTPVAAPAGASPALTVEAVGAFAGSVLQQHARSDRDDGLYSTVVVDDSGVALGLVFSSGESIRAACTELRGIYWSRSRKRLWRKGESSGAVQQLLQVALDCDGDAVRFTVRQTGPGFCHLNRWSCWPTPGSGAEGGLPALHRTLWERRRQPLAGSYTNRLLSDEGLLNSKVLEEARELVEARTAKEVASEAADLLYFTAVLLCKRGVSWAEVERCLDLRSLRLRRRAGNAKPMIQNNGYAGQHQQQHHSPIDANLTPETTVHADGKTTMR